MTEETSDQAMLPVDVARAQVRSGPTPEPPPAAASVDPIAQVLVDVPLAHLDRPFDYLVPESMATDAVPGARVKVRFAGQVVDGFVLGRAANTEHAGTVRPLRRTVSPEPVLRRDVAELTAWVAARYVGTRSDVLRLAVPPRHARTEKELAVPSPAVRPAADPAAGEPYTGGPDALAGWAAGGAGRVVWTVAPADDPMRMLAEAIAATASAGRGVIACLPDVGDVARLDRVLRDRLGEDQHVVLTADLGPARRYAAFLTLARGHRGIAIGTRAAAFAPVHDLGLVAMWDDGDDLYAEPRAPYPHAREVLLQRAVHSEAGAALFAHARSVEAAYLLRSGWAHEVVAPRAEIRRRVQVSVPGATDEDLRRHAATSRTRLPGPAMALLREASGAGPVLVHTPRSGYLTRLACETCRSPASCRTCHGPLRIPGPAELPRCAWCGVVEASWECPECGGRGLRAPVLGERRTAQELGRALPRVTVRSSGGDRVLDAVDGRPCVVVATPGAEPVAEGGYAAVLVLDTWLALARSDLRAGEESVRRWMNAASLVRPGGPVMLVGEPALEPVQALVRWDPGGFADREIASRRRAHLPPASRLATVTAGADLDVDLETVLDEVTLPDGTEVLGPVAGPGEGDRRLVVRAPRRFGTELSAALGRLQAGRSARKLPHLRVQVDPLELG